MALLFIDGFDHYTTLTQKWTGARANGADINAAAKRYGTQGLRVGADGGYYRTFSSTPATVVVGAAFYLPSAAYQENSASFALWYFREGLSTIHVTVALTAAGRINITRGGTTSLATGSQVLDPLRWYYVEAKAYIADASGTVEVRVDGVVDATYTGDTRNGGSGYVDNVVIGNPVNANYTYADDVYMLDTTGATNTTFLGDLRVEAIYPTGAGATTDWTPSTGANWQNVDEATPDSDTTYNSTAVASNFDTYAYGNLTPTSGTVHGLGWYGFVRKDDAGTRTVAPVYRTGGTDYEGAALAVSDSYAYLRELSETNPDTSSAWTISAVNGAEFGIKLKT